LEDIVIENNSAKEFFPCLYSQLQQLSFFVISKNREVGEEAVVVVLFVSIVNARDESLCEENVIAIPLCTTI
jgi:uncharacterized membrane protein